MASLLNGHPGSMSGLRSLWSRVEIVCKRFFEGLKGLMIFVCRSVRLRSFSWKGLCRRCKRDLYSVSVHLTIIVSRVGIYNVFRAGSCASVGGGIVEIICHSILQYDISLIHDRSMMYPLFLPPIFHPR